MVGRGGVRDPRINYLIYRQQGDTPGIDAPSDEVLLQCAVPGFFIEPHRIAYGLYCGLPEGYWGRDHGDDSGINPDQSRRALSGIYPSGGSYDSGEFVPQYLNDGSGGAGITPIILSSWMNFFDAEVAVNGDNKNNLLKVDIEGGEYKIIDQVLKHQNKIQMLIIEFHWINQNESSFIDSVNVG